MIPGANRHLLICNGKKCMQKGAAELTTAIRKELIKANLNKKVFTSRTFCNGECSSGCIVISYPDGNWYGNVDEDNSIDIINSLVDDKIDVDTDILYTFEKKQFLEMD
ncbi:(2Fe-2S) ferredoxin domain-containing protein [Shouchella patagoniensis]|uniref:(2Fe-2S) ferredoxin domain-containing protein n=1 Tax=Shouchella patagoniensis TaxID=228576 RepID=UPI000994FE4B|nr:(2Fe-2S) ferredoxin domain-containing protein [Shouchella patagoniensis]